MSAFEHNEEEEVKKSKKNNVKVPTTLASIESLTFPKVQEVVLLADYRCKLCRDRVANIVARYNGDMESMEITMTEKKVTFTFTGKYSKASKGRRENSEVFAICKNMVNKIFNFKSDKNKEEAQK
ncbi:uncharacterized protein [Rutidosis leptorrhynchoides]|uniref:uncharacterized protein n=1 Tax=Rutidosis leptorrhynchoides TaxID=125765 RepID=UPI003A9A2662